MLYECTKRLIQYNFRDDRAVHSFTMKINFENIRDFLVFEKKVYILYDDHLLVYNFKSEKILEFATQDARKLRRENNEILIISKSTIRKIEQQTLKTIFTAENSQIVDKNSATYFVIKENKLYLYPIEKEVEIK